MLLSCFAARFCHSTSLVLCVEGHHHTCLPLHESSISCSLKGQKGSWTAIIMHPCLSTFGWITSTTVGMQCVGPRNRRRLDLLRSWGGRGSMARRIRMATVGTKRRCGMTGGSVQCAVWAMATACAHRTSSNSRNEHIHCPRMRWGGGDRCDNILLSGIRDRHVSEPAPGISTHGE